MLPIFDVVKDIEGLAILSWLHDGVVIYHRDAERLARLLHRVKIAFDEHASALGFGTELEVVHL